MKNSDEILRRFLDYKDEDNIPFPKIGDWHSANAYAIFGEEAKSDYLASEDKSNPDSEKFKVKFKHKRDRAKKVGLSLNYGGTEYTVSRDLKLTIDQVIPIIRKYFRNLPVFKKYLDKRLSDARLNELVRDIFGRIRYLPKINVKGNKALSSAMDRLAYNAPIQMSGATSLKLIMISLGKWVEEGCLNKYHGNLPVLYKFYTRILTIKESNFTNEFKLYVESSESGNCKILVVNDDDDVPVKEYERSIRVKMSDIKQYGMKILY